MLRIDSTSFSERTPIVAPIVLYLPFTNNMRSRVRQCQSVTVKFEQLVEKMASLVKTTLG